jgi:CRP-like cAMP-binding protein
MGRSSGVADQLREFPLFSECDSDDLRALTRDSTATSVPAGWAFIHDETPGDACYVILKGEAEVKKAAKAVATLGAGDVVGEVALVKSGLRTANVIAKTELQLLHIDAATFTKLVDKYPHLRQALTARTSS